MSKYNRIKNIAAGIGIIILSIFMFAFPDTGYYMATIIFGAVLLIDGIKQMIYFIIYYFFVGMITIFRAYEARKIKAELWKWKLLNGIIKVIIAIACIVNITSEDMMLFLVCFGLIVSALTRIGMALKKTAIIFIQ